MKAKFSKYTVTALGLIAFIFLFTFPALVRGQTSPDTLQTPVDPSHPVANPPSSDSQAAPIESEREKAEEQIKRQEKQRILGIIPQFNVSNITDAVRLSPKQKLELAFKTSVDPFTFLFAAIDSGIDQATDGFPGYGQGAAGYGKRFGAYYFDSFDGNMIGNAFLPIVLHQDPRYFRKGTGSFMGRFTHAVLSTVICKGDNGKLQPNISNVVGNFAAGAISNIYYPAGEGGLTKTYQGAIVVSAQGAIGATLAEFWPDISQHFRNRRARRLKQQQSQAGN